MNCLDDDECLARIPVRALFSLRTGQGGFHPRIFTQGSRQPVSADNTSEVGNVCDAKTRSSELIPKEFLVRKGGFDPPRLSAPPPQDGVSASSTTSALLQTTCNQ